MIPRRGTQKEEPTEEEPKKRNLRRGTQEEEPTEEV